jgi:CubicO group peptidase (beta-lactamase class C family)
MPCKSGAATVGLLAFLCAALPATAGGLSQETTAQLEKVIAGEVARQKIPGMAAAVVVDRRVAWSKGFGLADVENSVPVQSNTVFRLASLSKPITAVAILQLVEKGQLDLDAPIQKYVPAFPEKPGPITSRHLLAHTSGIRHYRDDSEQLSTRRYDSLSAALTIFKDDPLLFQPGTSTPTRPTATTFLVVLWKERPRRSSRTMSATTFSCRPAWSKRARTT